MTRQTAQPLEEYRLHTTNRSAREVARLVADGYLMLDTPYQRGTAWSLDQRVALIRSWISGVPVPAIIWNDRSSSIWRRANGRSDAAYAMIDGRQRAETAVMWFGGEFAVPASWFPPEDVETTEETEDGPYVHYTGLTKAAQTGYGINFSLPVCEGKLPTVQDEAAVYLLVNGGGTPQTDEDMERARTVANDPGQRA